MPAVVAGAVDAAAALVAARVRDALAVASISKRLKIDSFERLEGLLRLFLVDYNLNVWLCTEYAQTSRAELVHLVKCGEVK